MVLFIKEKYEEMHLKIIGASLITRLPHFAHAKFAMTVEDSMSFQPQGEILFILLRDNNIKSRSLTLLRDDIIV